MITLTLSFLAFLSGSICQARDYDENFVKTIAFYSSKIASCDYRNIDQWNCEACKYFPDMQDHHVYLNNSHPKSHSQQSFCGYDPNSDTMIFSFRADGWILPDTANNVAATTTTDITEWIYNSRFVRDEIPQCDGCAVHSGFRRSYEDSVNNMLSCYGELRSKYPSAKVLATGHGLGAAYTHFLAIDLFQIYNQRLDYLITFGSPRVGNKAFADYVNEISRNSWRIVNNYDMVPHLPRENMGFTHISKEVWYNRDMTAYNICSMQEDHDCSWKISPMELSISEHTNLFGMDTGCTYGDTNGPRRLLKDRLIGSAL